MAQLWEGRKVSCQEKQQNSSQAWPSTVTKWWRYLIKNISFWKHNWLTSILNPHSLYTLSVILNSAVINPKIWHNTDLGGRGRVKLEYDIISQFTDWINSKFLLPGSWYFLAYGTPKYCLHCSTNLILRFFILFGSALHCNDSSLTCLDKRIAFCMTKQI